VLDAGAAPASGASGLPVGLYAPYLSADNNFCSQITAAGVQFTQKLARQLLIEGVDWQPSGVMTRKYGEAEQWHADAGWIKPAALVKACLSQANITWRGNCEVKRLVQDGGNWTLFDNDDQVLQQANMVVVAASNQSADLLQDVPNAPKLNFQAVRGQVTYGDLKTDLKAAKTSPQHPTHPINGGGSYIETDTEWLIGASYDRDKLSLEPSIRDQVDNFERLENLVPDMAEQLKPSFERGLVNNWGGIRCATTDRLPVVGEIMPGLWVCTAMASRGLTFAPLCAELLAALMHDEELPLNARLVRALSVQRWRKYSVQQLSVRKLQG
jgi:tRNA 5-methylaminomethyl-2-thiouridine biosynthesis bifunctional protein